MKNPPQPEWALPDSDRGLPPCEARLAPQKPTTTFQWFETYHNVTRLGRFLMDEGCNAAQLQAYYEKPWKWESEWNEMNTIHPEGSHAV